VDRILTEDEWSEELRRFEHTAFRVEQQRAYAVPLERELYSRFLAGDLTPPTDSPAVRDWLAMVATQVGQGKRMERVRVQDEPPTPYQRWQRWFDRWNKEAGESIRYMTRQRAHEVNLLPAAGNDDWWLLDSCRLMVMHFDDEGHLFKTILSTDPERVVQACAWRDLAVHHSAPEAARGQAA
jgi:hypothetical protein